MATHGFPPDPAGPGVKGSKQQKSPMTIIRILLTWKINFFAINSHSFCMLYMRQSREKSSIISTTATVSKKAMTSPKNRLRQADVTLRSRRSACRPGPQVRPLRPGVKGLTGERAVLVALDNLTGGLNWSKNEYWLTDESLSVWRGVTVQQCRVTRQKLRSHPIGTTMLAKSTHH